MADRLLGFVGVGRMGGPMASRLLDAGYRLCIYDLSEEATAAAGGARRRARRLAGRGRLGRRDRAHQPADARRGARGGAGRQWRHHQRLARAHPDRSLDHRAGRGQRGRGQARGTSDRLGRCPGERRSHRRQGRHARGHGVVRPADPAGGRADPEDIRAALPYRRQAGPRPDGQAGQQPSGRDGAGGDLRGHGDGRQGGPRCQGADRHHQRLERPQQRQPGQVPARRAAAEPSTSASPPASPTRTSASASRKPRRWACPWWWAAAVREMLAITKARFGADSDFTFIAKVLEEWAGVEIRG